MSMPLKWITPLFKQHKGTIVQFNIKSMLNFVMPLYWIYLHINRDVIMSQIQCHINR